eukprot:m.87117 g.87117  ORF g.87117 m.87117 type:complete len:57 (-) comp13089_c0_seq1:120-290(-)
MSFSNNFMFRYFHFDNIEQHVHQAKQQATIKGVMKKSNLNFLYTLDYKQKNNNVKL